MRPGGGQWLPRPSLVSPASGGPGPGPTDTVLPQLPAVPTMSVSTTPSAKAGGDDVNFDDLARRFEELKKRK